MNTREILTHKAFEYQRQLGSTYEALDFPSPPFGGSPFPSSARIALENLRATKVEWRVNNLELPVDGALEGLSFEPTTLLLVAHDVIVLRTFSAGQRYTLVGEAACFRSSVALIAFKVGGSGRTIEKWGITARRKPPSRSPIFSFSLIATKSRAMKSFYFRRISFLTSPRVVYRRLICYFKSLDSPTLPPFSNFVSRLNA